MIGKFRGGRDCFICGIVVLGNIYGGVNIWAGPCEIWIVTIYAYYPGTSQFLIFCLDLCYYKLWNTNIFCVWTIYLLDYPEATHTDIFSPLLCFSPFPSPFFPRKYVHRRFRLQNGETGHSVQWEQLEQKHRWVTKWSASIFLLMSWGRGHVPYFRGVGDNFS